MRAFRAMKTYACRQPLHADDVRSVDVTKNIEKRVSSRVGQLILQRHLVVVHKQNTALNVSVTCSIEEHFDDSGRTVLATPVFQPTPMRESRNRCGAPSVGCFDGDHIGAKADKWSLLFFRPTCGSCFDLSLHTRMTLETSPAGQAKTMLGSLPTNATSAASRYATRVWLPRLPLLSLLPLVP